VLVTGATGFVGRHCLEPLRTRGFEVHGVSRRPRVLDAGTTWHACDLLDETSRRSLLDDVAPTHLLHAAWYLEPGKYLDAGENLDWVAASIDLVRAFGLRAGERVVAVGSCFEYAFGPPVLVEESPPGPTSVYGSSKRALGLALRTLADATGLSLAWARLFFLYGPFEDRRRLVADIASSILDGQEVATGQGRQRRDYMFVEDAGDALAALLASDVAGDVNVATGDAPPVRELVERVADAAGRPELVRYGTRPMSRGEPAEIRADVTRLTEEVGWSRLTPRDEAVARTVQWWAAQRAGASR
jgi:nucleoside-diphosphate-sugar epimerase